jgi:hypothetical protein
MESIAPALGQPHAGKSRRSRIWATLLKLAVGVALLGALLVFGRIDFRALSALVDAPYSVVVALLLLLVTIPLAAVRWGLVLRALELPIPLVPLLHFVAIGTLSNTFLFGPAGADAIRGVYAWRVLGRGSGRIAASILVDRIFGLVGLTSLALCFAVLNWDLMSRVPALHALATSLLVAFVGCGLGAVVLLAAPRFTRNLERRLAAWPRMAALAINIRNLVVMLRTAPLALAGALMLAVAVHVANIGALLVLARALGIGILDSGQYVFAGSLALVTNALPLTPNGIGIGEAAFDQICRWLEPVATGAAYSSIFFAYRAATIVASLSGLASFIIYRRASASAPARAAGEAAGALPDGAEPDPDCRAARGVGAESR